MSVTISQNHEANKKQKAKMQELEKNCEELKVKNKKLKQRNIEIHVGDRKSNLKITGRDKSPAL